MNIIVDVNIILSALIRDSVTRKIILHSPANFYFPEASLQKIRKYQKYLLEKSHLSEEDFHFLLGKLFVSIQILTNEQILEKWNEAKEVMESIDEEDVIFIAAALYVDGSFVWSEDKHFEKQNKVKVLKTKHMISFFMEK